MSRGNILEFKGWWDENYYQFLVYTDSKDTIVEHRATACKAIKEHNSHYREDNASIDEFNLGEVNVDYLVNRATYCRLTISWFQRVSIHRVIELKRRYTTNKKEEMVNQMIKEYIYKHYKYAASDPISIVYSPFNFRIIEE